MDMAYCGLDCGACDACIATAANDFNLRERTARKWSAMYGAPITPEQIRCTGCRVAGVKFHYCESMCSIRKCASSKNLSTCAECPDYPCEQLSFIHRAAPQARENLEEIRKDPA